VQQVLQDATNKKPIKSAEVKKPTAVLGKRKAEDQPEQKVVAKSFSTEKENQSSNSQAVMDHEAAASQLPEGQTEEVEKSVEPIEQKQIETKSEVTDTFHSMDNIFGENELDLSNAFQHCEEEQPSAVVVEQMPAKPVEQVSAAVNIDQDVACDLFSPRKKSRLTPVPSDDLNTQVLVLKSKLCTEQHLSQTLRDQLASVLAERDTLMLELSQARAHQKELDQEKQRTWYMSLMHSLAVADMELATQPATQLKLHTSADPISTVKYQSRIADLEVELAQKAARESELSFRTAKAVDEQVTTSFINTILQQEKRELAQEFQREMQSMATQMTNTTSTLNQQLAERTQCLDALRTQMKVGMEAAVGRVRALQEEIDELKTQNEALEQQLASN
jgi:hypothetical protein